MANQIGINNLNFEARLEESKPYHLGCSREMAKFIFNYYYENLVPIILDMDSSRYVTQILIKW